MKLKIGVYEVEIKAKSEFNEKFNKEDTYGFILDLAVTFAEASTWYQTQGLPATSARYKEMWDDTHNFLEKEGYLKK